MVKTLPYEFQGRACKEKREEEGSSCQTTSPPALEKEESIGKKLKNNRKCRSLIPKILELPGTPAPWSRWSSSMLRRQPARRVPFIYSSTNLYEETEISVAKGSDPQSSLTDSILQGNRKAKSESLTPSDKPEPAGLLENFLSLFLTYLRECPDRPYFQDTRQLISGSGCQYEKFLCPGEFEVLFSIPLPDYIQYTEVENYSGLFYSLTLMRKSNNFPAVLLLEDGKTISPRNVMGEFWKHVDQFIKDFYSVPFTGWQIKLMKKQPNCPIVKLVIWDNQDTKFMSIDLIPALEMASQWPYMRKAKDLLKKKERLQLITVFYFVAEQSPGKLNKETWKVYFSHVEKEILNCHWSPEACCRKECLKMLYDHVDALKMEYPQMLAHLSSYHIRTSFLHTLWECKRNEDWKPSEISQCFSKVLANFIHEVATAHLPHFFIPKCNLFGEKFFPPTKLKFLLVRLREKEETAKSFTVSQKKASSALGVNSDMVWVVMITFSLMVLVLPLLSHI